ncbi:type VII secretion integral membrane protein EccD [Mycolicibacterium hippocampi]|uniref:type VII secretion integral membrane protein EccD n=1 Tax=Mycolicibacterium hippocampi TaxID=659824 RepID=UPI0021F2B5DD|nr:type VII secretion integral membrane protein EccD [Mycolicibacterium hippocampi]
MPDTLCRLVIHVTGRQQPAAVDLVLPADCPVGELIPSVVDAAVGESVTTLHPQHWYLTRVGGDRIDTSLSLRENAVEDGDLILLDTAPPPTPYRTYGDPGDVVARVATETGGESARAAVLSPGVVVVALASGFLAVPDAPWPAAVLLTASCGLAVSILLLRLSCGDTAVLTGLAAATAAVATAGAVAVATSATLAVSGAVLTVLSLAGLSLAPKVTVVAAGLGPARSDIDDARAAFAHRILTGLVAGWSCAATIGVAAVAAQPQTSPAVAVLFAADVGLLLLLRQRSHVDTRRRLVSCAAGLCALLAAHTVAVRIAPEHAAWLGAAAVIAGVGVLRCRAGLLLSNPVVRQSVQAVEYLALAAVVPLAAWLTGVYGMVRELSLS